MQERVVVTENTVLAPKCGWVELVVLLGHVVRLMSTGTAPLTPPPESRCSWMPAHINAVGQPLTVIPGAWDTRTSPKHWSQIVTDVPVEQCEHL
jgi:hypothetical protein